MNNQRRLLRWIAPLAMGCGLAIGIGSAAEAYPDNSTYYHQDNSGYHQRSFRNVQPFRSLNVTPRYHIESPADYKYRYDRYDRYNHHHHHHRYSDRDTYYRGQHEGDREYRPRRRVRRVHRRGFRTSPGGHEGRSYYRNDRGDRYIRIRYR